MFKKSENMNGTTFRGALSKGEEAGTVPTTQEPNETPTTSRRRQAAPAAGRLGRASARP